MPPAKGGQWTTATWGEAGSVPSRGRWAPAVAPAVLGAEATGRGSKQAKRGPRDRGAGTVQGTERPRHSRASRKTSAGPHRHTHEGGLVTPGTPASPTALPGAVEGPRPLISFVCPRQIPLLSSPITRFKSWGHPLWWDRPARACKPPSAVAWQRQTWRAPHCCGTWKPGPGDPLLDSSTGLAARTWRTRGRLTESPVCPGGPSPNSESGGAGCGLKCLLISKAKHWHFNLEHLLWQI